VVLDTVIDAPADAVGAELVRDDPISFDPRNRQYGWRSVITDHVTVANPDHRSAVVSDPLDPMLALEEKV
jgi:CRISPR system Cascade subunit CasD